MQSGLGHVHALAAEGGRGRQGRGERGGGRWLAAVVAALGEPPGRIRDKARKEEGGNPGSAEPSAGPATWLPTFPTFPLLSSATTDSGELTGVTSEVLL